MNQCTDDYALIGQRYGRHLRVVLEMPKSVSWNDLLRKNHWQVTEVTDVVRLEVMAALHELAVWPEPFSAPVHITITNYKGNKRWLDADNIPAKLYIDALKLNGVLVDDNPSFLCGVTTISRIDAAWPRIEIDIMEVA